MKKGVFKILLLITLFFDISRAGRLSTSRSRSQGREPEAMASIINLRNNKLMDLT